MVACAGVGDPDDGTPGDPLARLLTATAADARVAHKLAETAGDASGQRCWATVESVATERQGRVAVAVVGPLSAWQKARNLRRGIEDGIDERIRRDCAVLVLDLVRTGRRVGARLAPLL